MFAARRRTRVTSFLNRNAALTPCPSPGKGEGRRSTALRRRCRSGILLTAMIAGLGLAQRLAADPPPPDAPALGHSQAVTLKIGNDKLVVQIPLPTHHPGGLPARRQERLADPHGRYAAPLARRPGVHD